MRLRPAKDIPAGTRLSAIVAADFNADGNIDLAVGEYHRAVSVLLGNGSGDFSSPRTTRLSTRPASLAAADVDRDGAPDLVAGSRSQSYGEKTNSTVLLGKRDGTFRVVPYTATHLSWAVELADMDANGRADLLIGADGLAVALNDRRRPFGPPRVYNVAGRALAVADFNRDGRLDVAVAADGLHVLLGHARSGLGKARDIAPLLQAADVAVGDFNCDGSTDVVGLSFGGSVSVMLGYGDGIFTPPQPFPLSTTAPTSDQLAVGDLNGDEIVDLAVINHVQHGSGRGLAILLGDGAGGFASPGFFAVGDFPEGVVLADVDADERLDVITANRSGSVSVLLSIR
jgi:hypothetical protein